MAESSITSTLRLDYFFVGRFMKVLLVARHPEGGIKTYISYVYGDEKLSYIDLDLISPCSDNREFFQSRIPNLKSYSETKQGFFNLFFSVFIQSIKNRPDIIHAHGFSALVLSVVQARLLFIPHLVTTHDVFNENQFKGLKGLLKRHILSVALFLSNRINPVGRDACLNLTEQFPFLLNSKKVNYIRNGIPVETFSSYANRDVKSELGVEKDTILLGFFGRFMAQKGFSILVDAIEIERNRSDSKNICVVCFGWGGYIREEIIELKNRGLEDVFYFLPATDDMPTAIRAVDCLVIPSRWEACPLLPMEAMVSGAVVIASDCIGMREVTEGSPTLVFKSGCADSLAEKIQYFANNQHSLKLECEQFKSTAAERFDVKETINSLDDLYRSVSI